GRAWSGSTQEPAGVVGAERPRSPSLNRRDPSRPRRLWPQVAGLGCPGAAEPITGGPGKWWSAERKSEEAVAVAMIGGTPEPVVAKGLEPGGGGNGQDPRVEEPRRPLGPAANAGGGAECDRSTAWGRAV